MRARSIFYLYPTQHADMSQNMRVNYAAL